MRYAQGLCRSWTLGRERIEVAYSTPSLRVFRVLQQLMEMYGKPRALRLDNGARADRCCLHRMECRERNRSPLHPTRKARSERLHRTLQLRRIAMRFSMPMCSRRSSR